MRSYSNTYMMFCPHRFWTGALKHIHYPTGGTGNEWINPEYFGPICTRDFLTSMHEWVHFTLSPWVHPFNPRDIIWHCPHGYIPLTLGIFPSHVLVDFSINSEWTKWCQWFLVHLTTIKGCKPTASASLRHMCCICQCFTIICFSSWHCAPNWVISVPVPSSFPHLLVLIIMHSGFGSTFLKVSINSDYEKTCITSSMTECSYSQSH